MSYSATATLTFAWTSVQKLAHADIYWFVDNYSALLPASVTFRYSTDGTNYTTISYADVTAINGSSGATVYTFDSVISAQYLQIVMAQQGGTTSGSCVGMTEALIYTAPVSAEIYTSAALASPRERKHRDVCPIMTPGDVAASKTRS